MRKGLPASCSPVWWWRAWRRRGRARFHTPRSWAQCAAAAGVVLGRRGVASCALASGCVSAWCRQSASKEGLAGGAVAEIQI